MKFQVVYLPVGVSTFHMESAQKAFEDSKRMLRSITGDGIYPEKILFSPEEIKQFLEGLSPDLLIFQNITFANGAYAAEAARAVHCPVLLWTLPEPVIDGTRLRLNSLTGAYSAANAMYALGKDRFSYVIGAPDDEAAKKEIHAVIRAAKVKKELSCSKLAVIGQTPQGFGFGRALDLELLHTFGVTLEAIESRELMEKAKEYSEEKVSEALAEIQKGLVGLKSVPEKHVRDFARLYLAYKSYVREKDIQALASRCWPDFFTSYGTPVCAVLSLLNAEGLAAACETDAYGALSMYAGSLLTERASFFGDPVSMDEEENTLTFWHCGMAPCSLARRAEGACVGVHPNRKIGPVMDFGCMAAEHVVIFRIGRTPGGSFRFLICEGAALNRPKQFCGTSVVVKTREPVGTLVRKSVKAGWEPHYAVLYGDVARELTILADMLGIEVWDR